MIVNLTQHPASSEQLAAGVFDIAPSNGGAVLRAALTFEGLPSAIEIEASASALVRLATNHDANSAMIGGALWLMAPLARELSKAGIKPVFAFSIRDSVETRLADGSIRKTAVFRHAGFVPAVL